MSGYSTGRQGPLPRCLVAGCTRQDVCHPAENVALCYGHYAELWAHLDEQAPEHQNWPGSDSVIRAWVKTKQQGEPEVKTPRHFGAGGFSK